MGATAKQKLKTALHLFAVFFKIGLFSFGGGYAMLTMIEREVVDKYHYLTHDELMDVFAIAESTPGAVAINIATFIGTKQAGVMGGILTTLGVVLPSFLIILCVSLVIDLVRENVWVGYLFRGIRVGVLVLIARAVLTFWKGMKKNVLNILVALAAFLVVFLTDVSVIYVLLVTIAFYTLIVIFKNLRIKKLGIITDADAYQRQVILDAQKQNESTADDDFVQNDEQANGKDNTQADNTQSDTNGTLSAKSDNINPALCDNAQNDNGDENDGEGRQ